MQAVYTNENKRNTSRRTNPVGIVICARRSSRCVEGEYIRRSGGWTTRI